MCDYRRAFGVDIGFVDHFNTELEIPLNYSAICNFHTYKSLVHTLSFPARSNFSRRFLITASNKSYSSASVLKSSLNAGIFQLRILVRSKSLFTECIGYHQNMHRTLMSSQIIAIFDYKLYTLIRRRHDYFVL
jgi:hypothetical protein